jgi:hypothetical protein
MELKSSFEVSDLAAIKGKPIKMSSLIVKGQRYIETGVLEFDTRNKPGNSIVIFSIKIPPDLGITVKSQVVASFSPSGFAHYGPAQGGVVNLKFEIKNWQIKPEGIAGDLANNIIFDILIIRTDDAYMIDDDNSAFVDANFYSATYTIQIEVAGSN